MMKMMMEVMTGVDGDDNDDWIARSVFVKIINMKSWMMTYTVAAVMMVTWVITDGDGIDSALGKSD